MSKAIPSNIANRPPQHQVFLNFRGDELRGKFISHLETALKREDINVFIDNDLGMGKDLGIFLETIEKSRIAIAVISSLYTESSWCLDELAKIKECVEKGTLEVFPLFFKVPVETVEDLTGTFGDNFRKLAKMDKHKLKRKKWRKALKFVTKRKGEKTDETR
ncbi:unnamed protein product [Arabis nemorensis]|uniref:TIR domain-containing protein n=1 Tax=Arabis nemorensis TaxID=586526 RepID=A0A565C2X9_9BRAS|nr:unnamed protein product [Arabis nemorensis]